MATINLLPPELAPKQNTIKLARIVKRVSIVGFVVYIVGVLGVITAIVLLDQKLKGDVAEQEELKSSILALQETEQRLLLTQDRLGYADKILGVESAYSITEIVSDVLRGEYEGVRIGMIEVLPSHMVIKFVSEDSDTLQGFVDKMIDMDDFKNIDINGFRYSSSTGFYETSVTMNI